MLARVGFRHRDTLINDPYCKSATPLPKKHSITEDQHSGDSGGITAHDISTRRQLTLGTLPGKGIASLLEYYGPSLMINLILGPQLPCISNEVQ